MINNTYSEGINSYPYEDNTCSNDDRPTIIISGDKFLEEHVKQGVDALIKWNNPAKLFQMGGALVEIVQDVDSVYKIGIIKHASLKLRLAEAAEWVRMIPNPDYAKELKEKIKEAKESKNEKPPVIGEIEEPPYISQNAYPNKDIVEAIISTSSEWSGIPFLNGLINTPIPRKDGSIVTKYGYDEITGYYYTPGLKIIPIDDNELSQEFAKQAANYLMQELFSDFPLKDDASKANMLAALMTPILRPYTGLSPITAITKPEPGAGASLLIDLISLVSSGITTPVQDANIKNLDEIRKIYISALRAGYSIMNWDNLDQNAKFDSPVHASFLTSTRFQDRILGQSNMIALSNTLCSYLTGRNVKLAGDIPRRAVLIELLDIGIELIQNPKLRDFRHTDIKAWVLEHRDFLVYMILVMFRSWIIAGKPKSKTPLMGSFETWSEVIGGILEYAGVNGFLGNKQKLENEMNTERDEWLTFATAWNDNPLIKGNVFARILYDAIVNSPIMQDALPEELEKVMLTKDGKPNIKAFGNKIQTMKNVSLGDGLTIRISKDKKTKMALYCMEKKGGTL